MRARVNGSFWGARASRVPSSPSRRRLQYAPFLGSDFQDGATKCSAGRRALHASGVRSPSQMEVSA